MTTAIATEQSGIADFKLGVDALLEKRRYFVERILPLLVEGKDFYLIKGRRSCGKSAAEKIASIYGLTATFKRDTETLESFKNADGLVAFICTLSRNGEVVGEGRGAATVKDNGGDYNKCLKMAEKSSYISSVIRATGISDIFTSDLENMPLESIQAPKDYFPQTSESENESGIPADQSGYGKVAMISERQKAFLSDLVWQHVSGDEERERYLANLDSMTKGDASEAISSFLQAAEQR